MKGQTLLVLSDTHGNIPALQTVLQWAVTRDIDAAVFLGDGSADLSEASVALNCPWEKVRGNGDTDPSIPEASVLDFGGSRFFLTHGHRHALYSGYDTLLAAGHNLKADAILFGHLHIPILDKADGMLLINPGSIGRPRSRAGASFVTIECLPNTPLAIQFWGIKPGPGSGKIHQLKIDRTSV